MASIPPGAPPAGPAGARPAAGPRRVIAGAGGAGAAPPGASPGPVPGASAQGAAPSPEAVVQGIGQMASMIESALVAFAQAMPEGAQEFDQANELIRQGVAKAMQAQGMLPGMGAPPAAAGRAFPGGGFTGSGGGAGV